MSLLLNYREVLASPEPLQLSGQFDIREWLGHAGILAAEPLRVQLTARSEADEVIVEGQAETNLTVPCSRCAEPFTLPLAVRIHEMFSRTPSGDGEDSDVHFVADNAIDLVPYVAENAALAMPFVPLCREDCAGLCSQCGVNRNEQNCSCRVERVDPRLMDLQKFFES